MAKRFFVVLVVVVAIVLAFIALANLIGAAFDVEAGLIKSHTTLNWAGIYFMASLAALFFSSAIYDIVKRKEESRKRLESRESSRTC